MQVYILGLVISLSRRYILKLRIACNRRTDYMVVPTSTHNNVVNSTSCLVLFFFCPSLSSINAPPFFSCSSRHHHDHRYLPLPHLLCILCRTKILIISFSFSHQYYSHHLSSPLHFLMFNVHHSLTTTATFGSKTCGQPFPLLGCVIQIPLLQ